MEKKQSNAEQEVIRQSLLELHSALLKLHKALIDSERVVYEKEVGPIKSPNHFFQLLTSEPWFAWLRPISQLIVAIDETLDRTAQPQTENAVPRPRETAFSDPVKFRVFPHRSALRFDHTARTGSTTPL